MVEGGLRLIASSLAALEQIDLVSVVLVEMNSTNQVELFQAFF